MFEYLKTMDLGEQIAVVSPDVGGIKMAHAYSSCCTPIWPSWPSVA